MTDFRVLRYFIAVADELHFRKAAERLNITQPALSRTIQSLENDIGVALFTRDRRRKVSLTAAGSAYYSSAKRLIQESEKARANAAAAAKGLFGSISIGHTDDFLADGLPDLVNEFLLRNENIGMKLSQDVSFRLIERLKQGEFDGVFTTKPFGSDLYGCRTLDLPSVPIVLALSNKHRLAGKRKVSLKQVMMERHLFSPAEPKSAFSIKVSAMLARDGLEPPKAVSPSSAEITMEMVRRNYGVKIASLGSIPKGSERIKAIPILSPDATLERMFVWRSEHGNSILENFMSNIEAHF